MSGRRRSLLAAVLLASFTIVTPTAVLAAHEPPSSSPSGSVLDASSHSSGPTITAVLANVGNVSPHCERHWNKLCLRAVEDRVAASLALIDPDVVALIELLPPELCGRAPTISPFQVCSGPQDPPQVMRLLAHDDYDVVCGDRFAWDCLAVRSSIGTIAGCPGGYCGGTAPTLPAIAGCRHGFQNVLVDVELRGVPLTVGVAHPNAHRADCRARELADLFGAVPQDGEVLLLGDFNLDPHRMADRSTAVWHAHVGDDRRFGYRSGIAEHDPPYGTVFPVESAAFDPTGLLPSWQTRRGAQGRTIDHVVATSRVPATCTTLGTAPGTDRIDGVAGGLDHRAIACAVGLPGGAHN